MLFHVPVDEVSVWPKVVVPEMVGDEEMVGVETAEVVIGGFTKILNLKEDGVQTPDESPQKVQSG